MALLLALAGRLTVSSIDKSKVLKVHARERRFTPQQRQYLSLLHKIIDVHVHKYMFENIIWQSLMMLKTDSFINFRNDWKSNFTPRNLITMSAEPLLVEPTHYTGEPNYISDTENSFVVKPEESLQEGKSSKEELWSSLISI